MLAAPASAQDERHEVWLTVLGLGRFMAMLLVWWVTLFTLDLLLPNLKAGHVVVYREKMRLLHKTELLDPSKLNRVFIFGNSRVLAGFQTRLFETRVPDSSAFNLGLPNSKEFVPHLTVALERGERPTHVLITEPWPTTPPPSPSIWNVMPDDNVAVWALFPFRDFIHEAVIFAERSRRAGGPVALYRKAGSVIAQLRQDRGYYFIEGQRMFPDGRLPEDHRFVTDGEKAEYRRFDTSAPAFGRLRELSERYRFQVWVVPICRREFEAQEAGKNRIAAADLTPFPWFRVLGPEYYRLSNRYFADRLHTNPDGAARCTELLAGLVNTELGSPD